MQAALPGHAVQSLEQFIALVHPEDRAGVIARCERCRTEGAAFDMEFRIIRPDGTQRWLYDRGRTFCDLRGRPITDGDGRIARWLGMAVDVHALKEAQAALGNTAERLVRAQRAGGIEVWELDETTGAAVWSEEVAKLLGVQPDALDAVPVDASGEAATP